MNKCSVYLNGLQTHEEDFGCQILTFYGFRYVSKISYLAEAYASSFKQQKNMTPYDFTIEDFFVIKGFGASYAIDLLVQPCQG